MAHAETDAGDANRPAPGELRRVQWLINTADLEEGSDAIDTPEALAAWLREHALAEADDAFDAADVARVARFREALRRLLLSHNGGDVDTQAVAELDAVARESAVVVGFAPDGAPRLGAAGSGVDAVIGRVLAIVARADAEGTWTRLKTCPVDDCRWAFYDFSRNHSRTWCDMKVCGNRAKARTYRSRR
jgi:predicted RNA-binding Zn ribbon-like protein